MASCSAIEKAREPGDVEVRTHEPHCSTWLTTGEAHAQA